MYTNDYTHAGCLDRRRNDFLLDLYKLLRSDLRGNVHTEVPFGVFLCRLHLAELLLVFIEHHPLVGDRYLGRDHNREANRHQLPQNAGIGPIGRCLQADEGPQHPINVEIGFCLP